MKFKSRRRSGAGRKGSPAKGRSPFKRRSISRTKPVAGALDLEQVTEDSGSKGSSGNVQANICVAVRVPINTDSVCLFDCARETNNKLARVICIDIT